MASTLISSKQILMSLTTFSFWLNKQFAFIQIQSQSTVFKPFGGSIQLIDKFWLDFNRILMTKAYLIIICIIG